MSGNIIRLDTDQYTELNVTQFTLDAGWTLQPVGSGALILRSQTTVVIHGTINCSGNDGMQSVQILQRRLLEDRAMQGGSGGAGGSSTESATAGSREAQVSAEEIKGHHKTASGGTEAVAVAVIRALPLMQQMVSVPSRNRWNERNSI